MRARLLFLLVVGAVLLVPARAVAGMPSVLTEDIQTIFRLNESSHERFQAISFFLVGILVSTWVVRALWNVLARDFTRLPRLSYSKALAMVVLWGLLFFVVLTRISCRGVDLTTAEIPPKGSTPSTDSVERRAHVARPSS